MPDDTTAALQALLQQVAKLTETVTDQQKRMDDLHAHNGRLLDKVMDTKRENAAPAPKKTLIDIVDEEIHERKMRAANLEKDADGNWYPQGVKPKHSLTREEARDPRKYAAAKEAAAKAGATLTVVNGNDDPTIRRSATRARAMWFSRRSSRSTTPTSASATSAPTWKRAKASSGVGCRPRKTASARRRSAQRMTCRRTPARSST